LIVLCCSFQEKQKNLCAFDSLLQYKAQNFSALFFLHSTMNAHLLHIVEKEFQNESVSF